MNFNLNPLLKNKTTWYAMGLAMGDASVNTMSVIYATSLILSYYPASFLIYYTVIQAFFTSFVRAVVGRLVTGDYKKIALIQYVVFIILFFLSLVLMQVKTYQTPFIVAVIVSAIPALSEITVWNLLSLSFGFREYKNVNQYLQQSYYLGLVVASLMVPVIVSFFRNNALIFISTIIYLICFFITSQLPIQQIQVQSDPKKRKAKPTKIPLYYCMMIFAIIISTLVIITAYNMRLELGKNYSGERLSAILGYISSASYFFGFFVSSTCNLALKKIGLNWIRIVTPMVTLTFSLIALCFPSIWSIILLNCTRQISTGSFGALSTELTLNAIPQEARFVSKANIKSMSNTCSTLLLVILTMGITNTFFITLWLVPLSLIALFIGHKVGQYYKIALEQEAAFKRFSLLDEITPDTRPILQEIALNSLGSKDVSTIFYGLDLFAKLYDAKDTPHEVFSLLNHKNTIVRGAIIEFINHRNIPSSLPYLKQRFPKETDSEIQLKIVEEIARLDANSTYSTIQTQNLNSDDILILENLFLFLQNDKKNEARQKIQALSHDSNPIVRKMVAYTIGNFKMKDLTDTLKTLIYDEQEQVSQEALHSVQKIQANELIPDILNLVLKNKNQINAQCTLIAFGDASLPFLAGTSLNVKNAKTIIMTTAAIAGVQAEQALISMLMNANPYIRCLIAKYANEMACKHLSSPEFKAKALELITEECSIIFELQNKMAVVTDPKIQKEISLRIFLAKMRFLDWLAIASHPRAVNQLISSLLNQKDVNNRVLDKAIELLEIYITDAKTREYVNYVIENQTIGKHLISSQNYHDDLLECMMNETENKTETSMVSIIFELRAIRLFADLPAEVLLALAEETQYLSYDAGEVVFSKNDSPDGLYCVSLGEVSIMRHDKIITTISEHGFFGELALIDNASRVASAVAKTKCTIMYINKEVFNRLADDVPVILKTLSKVILEYARKNLELLS